jgi:hypothetical protein
MRVLTQGELTRMTRTELMALLRRISTELELMQQIGSCHIRQNGEHLCLEIERCVIENLQGHAAFLARSNFRFGE